MPVDGAFLPGNQQNPLFVVSSYNWRRNNTTALKMALSRAARHRSMIAGVESGTWLLAEASLLDNHKVTVHWEDQEEFSARYPQIDVVKERFVIDRRRMISSIMSSVGSVPPDVILRRSMTNRSLTTSISG